jgi:hypothetical protein
MPSERSTDIQKLWERLDAEERQVRVRGVWSEGGGFHLRLTVWVEPRTLEQCEIWGLYLLLVSPSRLFRGLML